ncbi:cytochrome C oxidase subunit IV family protein [Marinobacter salarius]|uniref:cytochrome C oxidase subunit IV family protein n=1 Tax=Marinobacter salarius TaxID=1420917 RepID=UPI0032ED6669
MGSLFLSRSTLIFALLVGATVVSWEFGHGVGFDSVTYASIGILVISFIKVRFVMREFMEVRHAPIVLRLVTDGWLLVICSVLIALYLSSF